MPFACGGLYRSHVPYCLALMCARHKEAARSQRQIFGRPGTAQRCRGRRRQPPSRCCPGAPCWEGMRAGPRDRPVPTQTSRAARVRDAQRGERAWVRQEISVLLLLPLIEQMGSREAIAFYVRKSPPRAGGDRSLSGRGGMGAGISPGQGPCGRARDLSGRPGPCPSVLACRPSFKHVIFSLGNTSCK